MALLWSSVYRVRGVLSSNYCTYSGQWEIRNLGDISENTIPLLSSLTRIPLDTIGSNNNDATAELSQGGTYLCSRWKFLSLSRHV